MCGGSKSSPPPVSATTPAPAPEAPQPEPVEAEVGARRKAEEKSTFGTQGPSMRVDRSATSGGVGSGGSGVRM